MTSSNVHSSAFVFAGPAGVGKTTAIATVSEIPIIGTDALATDDVAALKARTTVAMDYGQITLDDEHTVRLYGTPGQERFRFMWDILAKDALGLILLLDNSRPDPLADLALYLDGFAGLVKRTGVVIGLTRGDVQVTPTIDDYVDRLLLTGRDVPPILDVDIRQRDDVLLLMDTLFTTLELADEEKIA